MAPAICTCRLPNTGAVHHCPLQLWYFVNSRHCHYINELWNQFLILGIQWIQEYMFRYVLYVVSITFFSSILVLPYFSKVLYVCILYIVCFILQYYFYCMTISKCVCYWLMLTLYDVFLIYLLYNDYTHMIYMHYALLVIVYKCRYV